MGRKTLKCIRCESEMHLLKHQGILLGDKRFLARGGYMFTGRLEADIFVCPRCGKIELFSTKSISDYADADRDKDTDEDSEQINEIAATKCTSCGRVFSAYVSICPHCGETEESFIPQIRCKCCGAMLDFDAPKCSACGYVREEPPTILNSI